VDRYLPELEHTQFLPAAAIRQLQHEKLETLLRYVMRKNDYFREKYAAVDPIEDFSRLPVLTKQELRENSQRIVTAELRKTVSLHKTSGSTGEPLKFYRDRRVFGYTLASVYRAHRWHGLDIGSGAGMLWGIPSSLQNRLKMRARDWLLNRFRESEYNLDPRVLQRFYQDMQRRRPEYLYGYSSMVYEFALYLRENRLRADDLGMKGAVCTAESIPDYQRTTMEAVFGCRVISEYGSAETGIISYQCPRGRHHVSDDCILLEIIDEDGNALPVGEIGNVTVTVLNSFAAPIIRYQLGDLASLSDDTCGCGVNLSLIDRIIGRTSGVIITPQGRCFHSIALYYIMKDYADKFGGVRQFKVRQTHVDRLEFHIAAGTEFSAESQAWIEQKARETFGHDMRLEFFVRERLERSASGKLTDFETLLPVEEHLLASYRSGARQMFGTQE
jgi:phenylacetate-CoA ligase